MSRLERHERLRRLTEPLNPVKAPYYVRVDQVDAQHPAPGWYWVPARHKHPSWLGHGSLQAAVAIGQLLDRAAA